MASSGPDNLSYPRHALLFCACFFSSRPVALRARAQNGLAASFPCNEGAGTTGHGHYGGASCRDVVELLNTGTTTVNLGGWSFSDDEPLPGKWVFPARTLAPGGCLIVFLSEKIARPRAGTCREFQTLAQRGRAPALQRRRDRPADERGRDADVFERAPDVGEVHGECGIPFAVCGSRAPASSFHSFRRVVIFPRCSRRRSRRCQAPWRRARSSRSRTARSLAPISACAAARRARRRRDFQPYLQQRAAVACRRERLRLLGH